MLNSMTLKHVSTPVLALLGASLLAGPAFAQLTNPDIFDRPEAYCKLDDDVTYTKWSGQKSGTITQLGSPGSNWHALRNIANFEHRNDACKMTIDMLRMPGAQNATRRLVREHNTCSGTARDEIKVGNVSEDTLVDGEDFAAIDNFYITGVQLCNNNPSDASKRTMKGLRVRLNFIEPYASNVGQRHEKRYCPMRRWNEGDVRYVQYQTQTQGGSFAIVDHVETDERLSCNNWRAMRECPDGHVATGIEVNANATGLSGIRLACRQVIPSWTAPN